jgi:DNA modification methylase
MIIEKKKISDLIPAPYNPRQSTAKQEKHLKESLEKFGLVEPIIFNKQTGYIVGGHFRVRELKKLGIKEIECVIVDLNEEDEKELNIRLNANTGGWDWDTLANDWDVVDLEAWGLEIPQFDTVEELEASEDDYEVPEGGMQTDIVIGDLFEIGEHRLLCGDSTDSDAVERLMNGEKAELLLTDPPYGIGAENHAGKKENGWNQWEKKEWDKSKPESGVLQYFCQITDNQIIWGGNYFTDDLPPTMGWLIWDKGQRGFSLADGEMAWTSFNNALRIKEYARAKANQEEKNHPTQKPQEIIQWCFEYAYRHTKNEIKLVLDPYLGSGSTMVAAHQLKRKCYGMELDCKYVEVIVNRMIRLDKTLTIKRNGVDETQKWLDKLV